MTACFDDFGIDVLIVTSKHNVQYLLGGYYHFQFDYMEAIGISRWLPVLFYMKGALDKSDYHGHERFQSGPESELWRDVRCEGFHRVHARVVHDAPVVVVLTSGSCRDFESQLCANRPERREGRKDSSRQERVRC